MYVQTAAPNKPIVHEQGGISNAEDIKTLIKTPQTSNMQLPLNRLNPFKTQSLFNPLDKCEQPKEEQGENTFHLALNNS
uniref:Uncharacterized protein n=1 Tax=Anguilla anguilla TaxID=7936 RepID=A0A0E9T9X1_ANGAN